VISARVRRWPALTQGYIANTAIFGPREPGDYLRYAAEALTPFDDAAPASRATAP
jgi:hypothetical protein